MVVTICIGSSCHLKGSREIITSLEHLITEHEIKDKVELTGSFCMGECAKGVCVKVDEELHSVTPDTVETFFNEQILGRL